jgi:hypothetical protein
VKPYPILFWVLTYYRFPTVVSIVNMGATKDREPLEGISGSWRSFHGSSKCAVSSRAVGSLSELVVDMDVDTFVVNVNIRLGS